MLALGLLYALAAVGGLPLIDFDSTRDIVLWTGFLVGGAALLVGGQLLVPAEPRSRSARLDRRCPRRPAALLDARRTGRGRRSRGVRVGLARRGPAPA